MGTINGMFYKNGILRHKNEKRSILNRRRSQYRMFLNRENETNLIQSKLCTEFRNIVKGNNLNR